MNNLMDVFKQLKECVILLNNRITELEKSNVELVTELNRHSKWINEQIENAVHECVIKNE